MDFDELRIFKDFHWIVMCNYAERVWQKIDKAPEHIKEEKDIVQGLFPISVKV